MAENNSLLPSVIIIFQQSLLYVTQQFLVVTSKVKRNCNYTCQQSLHVKAWEWGCNQYYHSFLCTFYCSLAFISAKYTCMMIANLAMHALRNLCCASVILSIHTHILGPCMSKEYILCKGRQLIRVAMQVYIHYLTTICTYTPPLYLAFSAFEHSGSHTSAISTGP